MPSTGPTAGGPEARRPQSAPAGARDTSGLTSSLVLAYVERAGGRAAVDELLRLAAVRDSEAQLRDEHHWFPYADKIRLFDAAISVLGDPQAPRRIGESALEANVAAPLRRALRLLGSPKIVYANIAPTSGKFSTGVRMELHRIDSNSARMRFVAVTGVGLHPHDCLYNLGLLACPPRLFGMPSARVSHPLCACHGDETCVYDVTWG